MENKLTIPNCSRCGSVLKEITTKNGRKIYACRNWLPNSQGCQGDIYDPHREQEHKSKYPRVVIRWNVPSRSEPGKMRTVSVYESGDVQCNCFAGQINRFCFHCQTVEKELEKLLIKIKKENNILPKMWEKNE